MVLTILSIVGIGAVAFLTYQMVNISANYNELASGKLYASQRLTRANRAIQGLRAASGDSMNADTPAAFAAAAKEAKEARTTVEESFVHALQAVPGHGELLAQQKLAMEVLQQKCAPLWVFLDGQGTPSEQQSFAKNGLPECRKGLIDVSQTLGTVGVSFVNESFKELGVLGDTTYRATATAVILVSVTLILAFAGSLFMLRRSIVMPTLRLARTMESLAGGDLSAEVEGTTRQDELGVMARALQYFKDRTQEAGALARDAERMRAEADAERQRNLDADTRRAAAMGEATRGLGQALEHLAGGDLSFRLNTPFAPEFEQLRADFNRASEHLGEVIASVSEVATLIDVGTSEINQGSQDLARRTEQQAAALEETAATLGQITSGVSGAAKRLEEARAFTQRASSGATQSSSVVAEAIDAMRRIEESSNQVSSIISVIDEIAFQTNLLALNAGVEAARAGEAGKGFAVVAQEVRDLAQRSAKAAKEIKALIHTSSEQVEGGVRLVNVTGDALTVIGGHIDEINRQMEALAMAAREQSVGLSEINNTVNSMDQVTQKNAALVEESNMASAALAGEAARLRSMVESFRLQNQPMGHRRKVA
ncbi:hypothetical protein BTR14_02890 [Rhizobium rhizosphaerae]|uniref:Methyl-accepting chemotaxis protein n=1 Tax=Xaviernesmea rhizosphaerae TaxID=1672749 RepID=A0ABX3PJ13_9HYPH|nr:methyl-accepting chemotaxis protein [Xaviernesmea rhizosphaerae]OQP88391.1 hypothetical protein BTR14_02890 [Xaviernesmea rhizosphaerae]